jgi:hypothetical protein
MVEVKKADLKEALVIKFDGINFGAMDLEKAKALRDELNRYFAEPEYVECECDAGPCPLTLEIKIKGEGPVELKYATYDPLLRQSVFTFLV